MWVPKNCYKELLQKIATKNCSKKNCSKNCSKKLLQKIATKKRKLKETKRNKVTQKFKNS